MLQPPQHARVEGKHLEQRHVQSDMKRQYESNLSSRFWLPDTCGGKFWAKPRTKQHENRGFRRWVFLVHPTRIR